MLKQPIERPALPEFLGVAYSAEKWILMDIDLTRLSLDLPEAGRTSYATTSRFGPILN